MEEAPKYGVTAICESPGNRPMTLNEYQDKAMSTCMNTCANPIYMLLNLQGEVGELSSKVAKLVRKGYIRFEGNEMVWTDKACSKLSEEEIDALMCAMLDEAGDCLWQIAGFIRSIGFTLEEAAERNHAKLASRKQRGVIDGNGDER